MIKILVLGGTRYLGKAIVKKIKKNEFEIATLSRSPEKTDIKHFVCDRKNVYELKKVFSLFGPNIILDMINFDREDSKSISDLYQQGFISDLSHYIMISSFFVYNHYDYKLFSEKKLTENFKLSDIKNYIKHKIQSEIRLYNSNLMNITTILRLPFVFSADDYSNRFQRLCELSLIGNDTLVEPTFKYSLIRKDDAAEAIIKVLQSNSIGITDLSNFGHVTSKKLLETVKSSTAQIKNNLDHETGSFPYTVEKDICLNSQKITIDLPIVEALRIEAKNYWLSRYLI